MSYEVLYRSHYFTLYKVCAGAYAAVVSNGTGALGNAGIIDLGDQTIIFDTFQSPAAAKHLREAAEALTGRRAAIVINSHWHFDHTFGNQVFHDAVIMGTEKTREMMKLHIPSFLQVVKHNRTYPTLLKNEASTTNDYEKRKELLQNASDAEHLITLIDELVMMLPSVTMQGETRIYGSDRQCVVKSAGQCHSDDDLLLYVPEEGVLFAGDLLFHRAHPPIKYGNIYHWMKALRGIREMDIDVIIGGHGDIASLREVEDMQYYLEELQDTAKEIEKRGESAGERAIPKRYARWAGPSIYYTNLQALLAVNQV